MTTPFPHTAASEKTLHTHTHTASRETVVPAFLSDKFMPASLPEVYAPRRALLADLYAAAEDGFIYVTAPAGSGKTVSALLWLQDCKRKPVWIGLDVYDNALSVFYKLIAAGLCSTQPDNEKMMAILDSASFSASPVEHTISIISEMRLQGGTVPDEFAPAKTVGTVPDAFVSANTVGTVPANNRYVLVLDDMHLITNPEIMKSLPFVIRRLPQTFVTMVLSRAGLPQVCEVLIKNERQIIGSEHLRFTQNEMLEYYKSLGLFLTPEESGIAQTATNGWAIGVNAIAQSGGFRISRSGGKLPLEVFANFFEEHVWNAWDDSQREFCLCTCVADEFDTALAGRLTKRGDAGEVMDLLSRTNTFISRLHDETYRYHHLFTDFLRGKLSSDSAKYAALCKTAADYYMENKDYSMALRFWLDSGDYKNADKFLLHFMFYNHHGDIAGYVDFLRMYFIREFPEKAFRDFPALHVCCAWYYYMTSRYKEYEYHADEGYRHIARIALYDPKFVEFAMLMYSVDHRSEMIDKVKRFGAFGKLVKGFSKDGIIRYIASFTHNLPFLHRSSFDYSHAASTPKSVEKILKSGFINLLGDQSDAVVAIALAGTDYERNDLHVAYGKINALVEDLGEHNSVELIMSAKFLHHSILLKMERFEDAVNALSEMTDFVQNSAQFFPANLEAYKVKLALFDCDREAARSWLSNFYVVDADRIELYLVFQHFTTARAYMVLGDEPGARRYLTMLRGFGEALNRVCDFCEASVLLASLEWAVGNKKEAATVLEPALEKLQRYGYTRIVIDEGASVLPVLRRIAARTKRPDYSGALDREYVNSLVLEAHRFAKNHKGVTAGFANSQKPVKLSKQQINMLTLLGRGYSNAMIVEETGLKITTVKTHTAIAYEKLGVNNVVDAVLKAQELGLI